jgi:hypothetical protein
MFCACVIFGMSLIGCGGGGGSTAPVDQAKVAFAVKLTDGPISKARVYFSALKKDILNDTDYVETDDNGDAVLYVPKAVIDGLDSNDIPFFWAEATPSSKITTSGGSAYLTEISGGADKFYFKSYLPKAAELKEIVSAGNHNAATEVVKSSVISHFSLAEAMMIENKAGLSAPVGKAGLASLSPDDTMLSNMSLLKKNLDNKLKQDDTEVKNKLVYLAGLTKAVAEQGLTEFFASGKNLAQDGLQELLWEAVKTNSTFTTTAVAKFNIATAAIKADFNRDNFWAEKVFSVDALNSLTSAVDSITTAAAKISVAINPIVSSPILCLMFPYDGQSATISQAYEYGIRAALKDFSSEGKVVVTSFDMSPYYDSNGDFMESAFRLDYFGVDKAGKTKQDSVYSNTDVVAVASFQSGISSILAEKEDILILSSGTSSILAQNDHLLPFAASNILQSDAIMHELREIALEKNSNIPYIAIVETRGSLVDYELDLYSGVLNNQSMVESAIETDGQSSISTGVTTKVTYPQLIGTFFIKEKGEVPTASIKALTENLGTKPYVVYAGLTDGFISVLKAFVTSGIEVEHWYTSDGIYVDNIDEKMKEKEITTLPNLSVMSLGVATDGVSSYSTFVTSYNSLLAIPVTANTTPPPIFAQYGYDMGLFLKKSIEATAVLSRAGVKASAMTTTLTINDDGAVTGSKGKSVDVNAISKYDRFDLIENPEIANEWIWKRIGPADFGELSN